MDEHKNLAAAKKAVQIIVTHEFVGTQSLEDALVPIICDDIRKQIDAIRTLDNEDDTG